MATKNAHDWYKFAEKHCNKEHLARSLYLITGFYKARSWSLCSFNNPTNGTRKILAKKDDNYILKCTKSFVNPRHGDSRSVNQTVFITGFKITVGGLFPDPVVLEVTKSETAWSALVHQLKACLKRIRGTSSGGHNPRGPIGKLRTFVIAAAVSHAFFMANRRGAQPTIIPGELHDRVSLNSVLTGSFISPFILPTPSTVFFSKRFASYGLHWIPYDVDQKPDARVAITHDTQWMDMIKAICYGVLVLLMSYLSTRED